MEGLQSPVNRMPDIPVCRPQSASPPGMDGALMLASNRKHIATGMTVTTTTRMGANAGWYFFDVKFKTDVGVTPICVAPEQKPTGKTNHP